MTTDSLLARLDALIRDIKRVNALNRVAKQDAERARELVLRERRQRLELETQTTQLPRVP